MTVCARMPPDLSDDTHHLPLATSSTSTRFSYAQETATADRSVMVAGPNMETTRHPLVSVSPDHGPML